MIRDRGASCGAHRHINHRIATPFAEWTVDRGARPDRRGGRVVRVATRKRRPVGAGSNGTMRMKVCRMRADLCTRHAGAMHNTHHWKRKTDPHQENDVIMCYPASRSRVRENRP